MQGKTYFHLLLLLFSGSALGGCPDSHPIAFNQGLKCCDLALDGSNDSPLTLRSTTCRGKTLDCPTQCGCKSKFVVDTNDATKGFVFVGALTPTALVQVCQNLPYPGKLPRIDTAERQQLLNNYKPGHETYIGLVPKDPSSICLSYDACATKRYFWSNFSTELAVEVQLTALKTLYEIFRQDDLYMRYKVAQKALDANVIPMPSFCEVAFDEQPRCVARANCCFLGNKCNPGEGFCTADSECSSGPDGEGKCLMGACDTTLCSRNTLKCFKNTDKCCTRAPKSLTSAQEWTAWTYTECSATCGDSATKTATRTCVKGCKAGQDVETMTMPCEVDNCINQASVKMCPKPTSIYRARKDPIYRECLLSGKLPDSASILNSDFETTLEGCMFTCSKLRACKAFSFDSTNSKCYPKSSANMGDITTDAGYVTGAKKLCEPWMLMFKHDSVDSSFPMCPLMVEEDEDVLLHLPNKDHAALNLFSNLQQLEFMRDGNDELTLMMSYPKSLQKERIIWKQSTGLLDADIEGFSAVSGTDGAFKGLGRSKDPTIAVINDQSEKNLMAVGQKSRVPNFSRGFPGTENMQEENGAKGEATLVYLYGRRNMGTLRQFDITASTSNDKAHLLIDGAASCFPEESLYFKHEIEELPKIEISFNNEKRVVKGVIFYLRVDAGAPPDKEITNIKILVSDESLLGVTDLDDKDGSFEICATLDKISSPNKQVVKCDYPLEGQFLTIVKDSKSPTFMTFNEIVPLLLGKPEAFASSYFNDGSKKYLPDYSIDDKIGDDSFKSINEPYPWLTIDFGEPRLVNSVTLVVPQSYVAPGACPIGWTLDKNKCYFFSDKMMNYYNAVKYCSRKGGRLYEPHSKDVTAKVVEAAKKSFSSAFWLGMNNIADVNKIAYDSSGLAATEFEFSPGEPNEISAERCYGLGGNYDSLVINLPCTEDSLLKIVCETKNPTEVGASATSSTGNAALPTSVNLKAIEVRVGHERITKFGAPLNDRNALCATLDAATSDTGNFTLNCSTDLTGRYLTIQLLQYGYIHFDEIVVDPQPIDGKFSTEVPWGLCSKTCENGTRKRDLTCTKPSPFNGGKPCLGNVTRVETCNPIVCPVNGGFTEWSAWSECSMDCGVGSRYRSRNCSNPAPANKGFPCFGNSEEVETCGNPDEKCCVVTCCDDYYLLEGNDIMWPNHPRVTPLASCCARLVWQGGKETCQLGKFTK